MDASILINTYNRPELLVRVVAAVLRQQAVEDVTREIIVVDDGSKTNTQDILRQHELLSQITFRRIDHGGQSTARNAALEMASGEVLLFLGDDIIPDSTWLQAHLNLIRQSNCISLGFCRWDAGEMSPALRQYQAAHHYDKLQSGQLLDFRYFYTANLALPREAIAQAGRFDTTFSGYGWEDTDLGYRLQQAGWQMVYNSSASATHEHPPMSIRQMLQRQEQIGFEGCRFYAKHKTPEVEAAAFWPGTREKRPGPQWRQKMGIIAATLLETTAPQSFLLGKMYGRLVVSARCRGVQQGRLHFPDAGI